MTMPRFRDCFAGSKGESPILLTAFVLSPQQDIEDVQVTFDGFPLDLKVKDCFRERAGIQGVCLQPLRIRRQKCLFVPLHQPEGADADRHDGYSVQGDVGAEQP